MPALKIRGRPSNARWLSTVLSCRSDQKAAYSFRALPDAIHSSSFKNASVSLRSSKTS